MKKDQNYIEYEDGTKILLNDDDVPELSDSYFKNAVPLKEKFPELAAYAATRQAGDPRR